MNRSIKFRVWDNKSLRFLSENEFTLFKNGCLNLKSKTITNPSENTLDQYYFSENRFTIQQFTGLLDKNGREIYEGDIVQYNRRSSYDGINFEVKWSEDNWGWVLVSKNKDYLINEQTPEGYRYEFIEIVGNIFENPDLLKQYARN